MDEFIEGLIMLIIPLAIVGLFIIKWYKDYKKTGKVLVLYDKNIKRWKLLVYILFLIFSVIVILAAISVITENSDMPIRIIPEQYNPWGWYTYNGVNSDF